MLPGSRAAGLCTALRGQQRPRLGLRAWCFPDVSMRPLPWEETQGYVLSYWTPWGQCLGSYDPSPSSARLHFQNAPHSVVPLTTRTASFKGVAPVARPAPAPQTLPLSAWLCPPCGQEGTGLPPARPAHALIPAAPGHQPRATAPGDAPAIPRSFLGRQPGARGSGKTIPGPQETSGPAGATGAVRASGPGIPAQPGRHDCPITAGDLGDLPGQLPRTAVPGCPPVPMA